MWLTIRKMWRCDRILWQYVSFLWLIDRILWHLLVYVDYLLVICGSLSCFKRQDAKMPHFTISSYLIFSTMTAKALTKKAPANAKNKGKVVSLIKKSNDLIESRYNFDIWEMRIFLMLIAQIRREDDDFRTYRIWYRDVAKVFKLNQKRGYAEIRDAVKNLLEKKVYVDVTVDGFKRKEVYHFIRKLSYLEEGQEGKKGVENQEYIDVKIEDEMKPLLLQLQKSFTAYELGNVVNLGVYAVRVYELLKQYESIGHRTLSFEELKLMFELEDKYPLFSGFFTFVIEPALREINEFTDIYVDEAEKIKEGKKIVAIRFKFHRNSMKMLPQSDLLKQAMVEEPTLILTPSPTPKDGKYALFYPKIVENLGVTESVFSDLLKIYTTEQLEQAIRVTNRAKIDGQIKTNVSGFFIQAIKNGYTDVKEERVKKEKRDEDQKRLAEQIHALDIEKENKIFDRIRELTAVNPNLTGQAIEALKFTEAGKNALILEEQKLGRPLDVDDYRQIKPLRMLVIETLFVKNIEQFSDILADYEAKMKETKMISVF
jgi:plasmid replication initiation protein